MPFPSDILKLSELIADVVTGATIATAKTGARVMLSPFESAYGGISHAISFYTGETGDDPGYIYHSADPASMGANRRSQLHLSPARLNGALTDLPDLILGWGSGTWDNPFIYATRWGMILKSLGFASMGGGAGTTVKGMQAFRVNDTTNASGNIFVNHDFGFIPPVVLWFDEAANQPYAGRHARGSSDSTRVGLNFRRTDSNAVAGGGVAMQGSLLMMDVV